MMLLNPSFKFVFIICNLIVYMSISLFNLFLFVCYDYICVLLVLGSTYFEAICSFSFVTLLSLFLCHHLY